MNKVAILGDTHFGVRGDSLDFHNYYSKFYNDIFFPYLIQNGIKIVFQLGDSFDRRKYINMNTLFMVREYFYKKFEEYDIKLVTIIGNHDTFFKNTLKVNSPDLLISYYNNVDVITDFTTLNINGVSVDLVPWICDENTDDINSKIRSSSSAFCMGHFEINGFEVNSGSVFKGSTDQLDLSGYKKVLSGHFHHKSDDGHIFYIGTPGENTWADWNDSRGFHTFDVLTSELVFIPNPYRMFNKLVYDDTEQSVEFWGDYDYNSLSGSYVKMVIINKSNPFLFDTVLDNLYKAEVGDISIVEDFTDEEIDDVCVDQAEDTMTILDKVIDTQALDIDADKLKKIMREIYIEALDTQKTE